MHSLAQDHIFGDPEEAAHLPVPPRPRRVPLAGLFGAHELLHEPELAVEHGELPPRPHR